MRIGGCVYKRTPGCLGEDPETHLMTNYILFRMKLTATFRAQADLSALSLVLFAWTNIEKSFQNQEYHIFGVQGAGFLALM